MPQSIPLGDEVTVPEPDPLVETVSVCAAHPGHGSALNVAATVASAFNVTIQVPVPEQAPDQPVKALPGSGVAVSVTSVPQVNGVEQVMPQSIPLGDDVTVPEPDPAVDTERFVGPAATVIVEGSPSAARSSDS